MPRAVDPGEGRPDPAQTVPSAGDIRAQMERVLQSPAFRDGTRRRDLLRFLVEETLDGRADGLKGYTVAVAVFGRDETFDPTTDPVVRFEARRLRRDLDSYYVDAGVRDLVRITIPKGGYVPHFEWRTRPALPEPEPEAPAELPTPPSRHARQLRLALVVAAVLLAAAAGTWLWLARVAPPVEQAHGPSIIVLPFETLSDRDDDRFLAAGVTQDLIANLMRFEGFRLFSVPASFRQDGGADPLGLGRDLGVEYVVKGSVGSDAATVRLTAQLYDARTGAVVWSQAYDRTPTAGALLGLRADVASDIATVLGQPYGVVNTDMAARLAGDAGPSMQSYACVLRANAYRRTFRDDLRQPVLACLDAAVRRDPGYADPWALLGWLHLDAARNGFVPDAQAPAEMATALDLAARAVAIDPENVTALRALSAVQYHLGDFDESERIQRQALALNPNDPDTLAQLAWRLAYRGRWDEGLAHSDRAIARSIDPPGWYYDPRTSTSTSRSAIARCFPPPSTPPPATARASPSSHRLRRPRRPRRREDGARPDGRAGPRLRPRPRRGLAPLPAVRGPHRPVDGRITQSGLDRTDHADEQRVRLRSSTAAPNHRSHRLANGQLPVEGREAAVQPCPPAGKSLGNAAIAG